MGFRKLCKGKKNGIMLHIKHRAVTLKDNYEKFVILCGSLHTLTETCRNVT